jgi:hypothetical protein
MGLLLDTIPDWGLSLRVVFTTFAVCMVTALVLVQRGIAANRPPTIPGVPKSSEPARSRADGPSPVSGEQRKEIAPNAAEWAKHRP